MTQLRVVETPEGSGWETETGDCFPCWNGGGSHDVEGRPPCWVIRLPGEAFLFHTNMTDREGAYWDVSGEPPNLTVHPSINVGPEIWHGWITDGVLSPDLDSKGNA